MTDNTYSLASQLDADQYDAEFRQALPFDLTPERNKLYLMLRLVHEKRKFAKWLSEPCPHGVHGVCDKCDEEDYRVNGFISGTEVA